MSHVSIGTDSNARGTINEYQKSPFKLPSLTLEKNVLPHKKIILLILVLFLWSSITW